MILTLYNFILTVGEECKNIVILFIKVLLREISGKVCKNNPIFIYKTINVVPRLVLMRYKVSVFDFAREL